MFNPSRDAVRRFFCSVWRRYRDAQPLQGLEALALEVILKHPEYQGVLDEAEKHLARDYFPEAGETNPFLHLSMHMALSEQLSIDQPRGVRAQYERLLSVHGDVHDAEHAAMECLAEMLWQAQRSGGAPDASVYLACLESRES